MLRQKNCPHIYTQNNCERSELPSLFNARIFYIFIYIYIYIYIYIFQAVRRAVNEMFETPDTVFNNLELLVNPSSTAEKCSATEDCCRNPGGDRRPSSTVKYCSATGLLPNRQRGERPGVNRLPFSPKLYSSASNMTLVWSHAPQIMVRFYTSATLCCTMVFLCI